MQDIRYKILLVEDNELDRKSFDKMVKDQELPYDCTVASSLSQAGELLESKEFDLVIADYILGDGTGFDVLKEAGKTPLILVTGMGDEEVAVRAWKSGAVDYLIKDKEQKYLKLMPLTVENAIKHHKTERKLHSLLDAVMSADDGVYITDSEDRIVFVNRSLCQMYDYSEQELIGRESSILWTQKSSNEEVRKIFGTIHGFREIGFCHRSKKGGEFLVSHTRSCIRDENGNYAGVIGLCSDISRSGFLADKVMSFN